MKLAHLADQYDVPAVNAIAGSFLLALSGLMAWLATPLQGKIAAYAFPLMENVGLSAGLDNPFQISSFGVIVFALGILGSTLAILRWHPRLLFYLGGTGILVCLSFVWNLVFVNSGMLESLWEQNVQASSIKSFSAHLAGNAKAVATYSDLATDTLLNRMDVGRSYLSFGWYAAVIGALMMLISSVYMQGNKSRRRDATGFAVILLAITAGLCVRPLKAEHDRIHGDLHLARGEFQKANELYASALQWDKNLIHNPQYFHQLGAANYFLGRRERSETHIYLGDNYTSAQNLLQAIRNYEIAVSLKPDLLLARKKLVLALIALGLEDYGKGKIYTALSSWRKALDLDPNQIQAHYFLIKAFLDIHSQDQSKTRAEARMALDKIKHRLVRADIYNLLGDSYYKQRDFVMARAMYNLSREQFQLVKILINFNAMRGLQGM